MAKKTFPTYVLNFKAAYENLYASYLAKGNAALVSEDGAETPEFVRYAKAVRELIRIKMNKGRKKTTSCDMDNVDTNADADNQNKTINYSNNSSMVDSLRNSGEYNYYKIAISESKSKVMPIVPDDDCDEIEDDVDILEYSEIDNSALNSSSASETKPEYTVIVVDDVLDHLSTEILCEDVSRQYYLKKGDSGYAYRSISVSVHNELVDMCKKLPKPIPIRPSKVDDDTKSSSNTEEIAESMESITSDTTNDSEKEQKQYYRMVNLDTPITDSEGNTTSLSSVIADPSRDTEQEAFRSMLLEYGISSFVHEMVDYFLQDNKPHYMLSYLNNISGGTGIGLYKDIYENGYTHALRSIIERLKTFDINVDYLNNIEFKWKKPNKNITKNTPNNWIDEAMKIVDARVLKKKNF